MGLQVAIIFIGKSPFHIVNDGLTGEQWGICFGFSKITFVVSFIVKLIPLENLIDKFLVPKIEEKDINENEIPNDIQDLKVLDIFNEGDIDKVEISKRKNKRQGSNRLINRENNTKRATISSRLGSYKNLSIYGV